MRKYMSIFDPSHEKLIEFINRYYTRRGWRIISIVKGNGDFWATLHEGRYSKLRLITKKAATKVTPAVDKYMLAWSAVKGRYINSSVSNKKVNSAAIVECKGFKVRERQI